MEQDLSCVDLKQTLQNLWMTSLEEEMDILADLQRLKAICRSDGWKRIIDDHIRFTRRQIKFFTAQL